MTKILNGDFDYAKYCLEDEDDDMPFVSQMHSASSVKPKENSHLTAKIIENKLFGVNYTQETHSYRVADSIISSNSSNSQISQLDYEEDTQTKRRRFLESNLSSTNKEAAISTNTSLHDELSIENINIEDTSFYGLTSKVKDLLKALRGISCLYEWQDELLNIMTQEKPGQNLLYLSPTSGGKTLVAEILILQCLLLKKKSCIFVMPFVSIVQEKVESLMPFGENLNFYVEEFAGLKGSVPPIKRQSSKQKQTLYICTIEKAHSLVNSLIETERLNDEIGLVVADELHMIGDGPRGAIYEMILSKVKYCSERRKASQPADSGIQIVATTATLENKDELAVFLNGIKYERDFRPVDLKEYIKLDKQVFEIDKKMLATAAEDDFSFVQLRREISMSGYTNEMKMADPDGLIALIKEVFELEGTKESCLIFCSTKKNCENVAQLLAKFLPKEFTQYKRDLKLRLFNDLREQNSNNICPVLRQSLQYGIAYHHSGLTTEERQLIEQAYRDEVLFLLTCTSTLAAGVNLPAKRVVIRSPYVGRDFISTHQYKQMIGRAGRAGFNVLGESILMFQNMDRLKVYDLISGPMKRCESSIEFDSKAIRVLVLSLIGLNLALYGFNVLEFFKQTLFYIQQRQKLVKTAPLDEEIPGEFSLFTHALTYLLSNSFISIKTEGDAEPKEPPVSSYDLKTLYFSRFEITKLGMAAVKGGIDLDFTQLLYSDLKLGLKTMVLSNYLHLLYLCTPYELTNSLNTVDFDTYARKVSGAHSCQNKSLLFLSQ